MSFAKFVDSIAAFEAGLISDYYYLSKASVADVFPELLADIFHVPLLPDNQEVDVNIWVSPKGAASPLHFDLPDNFLVQISGRKLVVLFDSAYAEAIPRFQWHTAAHHISMVDLGVPSEARTSLLKNAVPLIAVLSPGDMLYIPPRWWHYVVSLDTSISINMWWQPWFRPYLPRTFIAQCLRTLVAKARLTY